MTQANIVVISKTDDDHLPLVQAHLEKPITIVDPARITGDTELSYSFCDNQLEVRYADRLLTQITSVWYRKPARLKRAHIKNVPDAYAEYSLDSLQRHISLLRTSFPDALWVSDYYAILQSENKTMQYRAATDEDLQVPDTLATNNIAAAKHFIKEHDRVIVKRFGTITPDGTSFPTTLVTDAIDLDGLHLAPAVFQKLIEPKVELRVTVIGHDIFVAGIEDRGIKGHPQVRDWRLGQFMNDTLFQPYDGLSDDIQRACIGLVKRLGLQYGAIDLIVDKQNKVWFLEINPNGQWGFIEDEAGLPLGKSMAGLLSGRAPAL